MKDSVKLEQEQRSVSYSLGQHLGSVTLYFNDLGEVARVEVVLPEGTKLAGETQ